MIKGTGSSREVSIPLSTPRIALILLGSSMKYFTEVIGLISTYLDLSFSSALMTKSSREFPVSKSKPPEQTAKPPEFTYLKAPSLSVTESGSRSSCTKLLFVSRNAVEPLM